MHDKKPDPTCADCLRPDGHEGDHWPPARYPAKKPTDTCEHCGAVGATQHDMDDHTAMLCENADACHSRHDAKRDTTTNMPAPSRYFDVVFDGPPGPEAGRFIEVENERRESVSMGQWIDRGDGTWALRIAKPADVGLPLWACGCGNSRRSANQPQCEQPECMEWMQMQEAGDAA